MKLTVEIAGQNYTANVQKPLDITIPVRFDGQGLTAFGASAASGEAYRAGDYVGDVREGGSCNCEVLSFAPHLHGTHTECVGHISEARIALADVCAGGLHPATLITVQPVAPSETQESYVVPLTETDQLITAQSIQQARGDSTFTQALVIRTLPNATAKRQGDYAMPMPPFFTSEAMQMITDLGVQHLLIDTPSVDRLEDEGRLSNHHIFWEVEQGSHAVDAANPSRKTITELIYVPDSIQDGQYLLDLQVAGFRMDAAPSRPILYEVTAA